MVEAGLLCALAVMVNACKTTPGGTRWTNSLGMRFVPVPGTDVKFCVWETRVRDYAAFAKATQRFWPKPEFAQEPTHPAVLVNWDDAQAFCRWLTERERSMGKIMTAEQYRLPTDVEWSSAVGLIERGRTPRERENPATNAPAEIQWPVPRGAGNFAKEVKADDYDYTAPVGSFRPNQFGLYDMSGNVWEWCEDFYSGNKGPRVMRGASWDSLGRGLLRPSRRMPSNSDSRFPYVGFRVVLGPAPK